MEKNITDNWNQKKTGTNFNSLSLEELKVMFNEFYDEIEPYLNTTLKIEDLPVDKKIVRILPAIRMILSKKGIKVASILNNTLIRQISLNKISFSQFAGPVTPGELIISDLPVLYIENSEDIIRAISVQLEKYNDEYGADPELILIEKAGMIAVSGSSIKTNLLLSEFEKKIKLILSGTLLKEFLTIEETAHISTLKNELLVPEIPGKVSQKVVVITGGAQGFGAGIAEDMFAQGANLIVADINENIGSSFVKKLNNRQTENRAVFVKTDVSDPNSVQNLVFETVRHFGGIDIFISNAGVLRAGGLDEMTPELFEIVTKVNYSGYFLCAKYASEVMKIQSQHKQNYYTDIIQINSKSGLKGSNKNFAYAGGKFGGIGLTQSFAMELMPFNIKVNSICPGNFFDGPLWSDPVNGLFVQYLNAGKVPDAKNIKDVKKFYESQVPAKRGCNVNDVMKAIYYVIDQEYETGQAVPVTGGQNMLN